MHDAEGHDPRVIYELPLLPKQEATDQPLRPSSSDRSLPLTILMHNVKWFAKLRWCVSIALTGLGVVGARWGLFRRFGLAFDPLWLVCIALLVAASNLVFILVAGSPSFRRSAYLAHLNLWAQIVIDLFFLTAVVHFLGGAGTYAPFAYLGHIVLSCIFFSRRSSLLVVLLSAVLFVSVVLAEWTGLLPAGAAVMTGPGGNPLVSMSAALHIASAIAVWLAVWYLASQLSYQVRKRDEELALTNIRLTEAGEDRARHMIRTTHELKAPFAAIHANVQLLLRGNCGELPEDAVGVVHRIERRCTKLSEEIKQMLQLANLRSQSQQPPDNVEVDLVEFLTKCVERAQVVAAQRGVAIRTALEPASVFCVPDHVTMMFDNLLTNAVVYSREGGEVFVEITRRRGRFLVRIQDSGIGISSEKLPHIFEDHYRTEEAVAHNKWSSGLGLAIVRRIAQTHGLRIKVETVLAEGTTFLVSFPVHAGKNGMRRRRRHGIHIDR